MGPPPKWLPAPPQPPAPSVWSRIAAYVVLIAVVAAAAGAGIGWSLARAINTHQASQSTTQTPSPITSTSPITPGTPGTGSTNPPLTAAARNGTPAPFATTTPRRLSLAAVIAQLPTPPREVLS